MRHTMLLLTGMMMALASGACAEVKLHGLFADGAVLQQGRRLPLWGTAREGEEITVRFQEQTVTTRARDGKWMAFLEPLSPGGPYSLTIKGDNRVEINNLLVGEVFVCSGQSNMEWPLTAVENAEQAIAESADPQMRLFTVPKGISDFPFTQVEGGWSECSPQSVAGFSAVAYYFGRKLRQELKVPVGLIGAYWGGTPAEAWTSQKALQDNRDLRYLANWRYDKHYAYQVAINVWRTAYFAHQAELQRAKQANLPPPKANLPQTPPNPFNQNSPTALYNAMLAPIVPYGIRGAIWYQGESNAWRAYEYQNLFRTMIQCWRKEWKQGDFPFYFVQLAPFKINGNPETWAELREAQRQTALKVRNTGMAVITDVGDEKDIHPRKKREVGERLALLALAKTFGKRVDYSGPEYAGMRVRGNAIEMRFKHASGGLTNAQSGGQGDGGEVTGFMVCGEDRKFFPAKAVIQGDKVMVSAPEVAKPIAARFGWTDVPVLNLFNRAGLPASPFRTDDFPFVTLPARLP